MIVELLKDMPIRRKLAVISMAAVSVALALACAGFVLFQQIHARKELIERVEAIALMAGENSASALLFHDPKSAEATLAALQVIDDVTVAGVYDPAGTPFAGFANARQHRMAPALAPPPGEAYGRDRLEVTRRITVDGEVVGTVYVQATLRELSETLWRNTVLAAVVMFAASLITLLLARRWTRVIADPVAHLADIVCQVATTRDYSVRAEKVSDDELGRLIDGFNEMLGQIQQRDEALRDARDGLEARVEARTLELELTHQRLLEASRLGGMAEVATNVLHNVGNVLNSVNVSANLVAERIESGGAVRLERVVGLLKERSADLGTFLTQDPRGRQVPAYLERLVEHMRADELTTSGELYQLRKNIDHIIEIVSMQQTYAKHSGTRETLDVRELVKDSVRMNEGALARHGVMLEEQLDEVPPVTVERHKVLQILVNLVRNAKLACAESSRPDKRVVLCVGRRNGHVSVSVTDNGVGIAPENLTQIFSHGFTTRKDGHGFGLHSGALAAREMGGALRVHSDGPGLGATFTLELPLGQGAAS